MHSRLTDDEDFDSSECQSSLKPISNGKAGPRIRPPSYH